MVLPVAANEHYLRQKTISEQAGLAARRLWRQIAADDIDGSWRRIAPRIASVVAAGQLLAVNEATSYVPAVLAETGQVDVAEAAVRPATFATVAPDGRPLIEALNFAPIRTKAALAGGATIDTAVAATGTWLDRVIRTQVADAGRVAASVEFTVRPAVTGYVRTLRGGSCSRCVILAGKTFRWNDGFLRHPQCDCQHIPVTDSFDLDEVSTDPKAYFDSLTTTQQNRTFTGAGAQAIRDGADMGRVINARQKMYTAADGFASTWSGSARRGRRRLMPEAIYKVADGDRARALELLRSEGFIF